jgi:hypothetical protein
MGSCAGEQFTVEDVIGTATFPQVAASNVAAEPFVMSVTEAVTS